MEPERDIEKLLRDFAKKRREQVGDAFKLHPATRQLLQGEAAHHKPEPAAHDASSSLWILFRQRLALVLSVALIVLIGAALLLFSLDRAKHKAQNLLAINDLKQIGLAIKMSAEANGGRLPMSLGTSTNEPGADRVLIDPQNDRWFVYLGGGKNLSNLQPDSVLAYSVNEDNKGRTVLLADGTVASLNDWRFSELTSRDASEFARTDEVARRQVGETSLAASAPQAPADATTGPSSRELELAIAKEKSLDEAGYTIIAHNSDNLVVPANAPALVSLSNQAASGAVQKFVRAGNRIVKSPLKNTAAPAQTVPVLVNFQVEQNGNAISVVDEDGSVYKGSFVTGGAVLAAPATPQQIQSKTGLGRNFQLEALNNSFRVSGTNQTLKQNVVFTGSLLAISNAAPIAGGNIGNRTGGIGQNQLSLAKQSKMSLWSNSRIAGTAVIDDTNRVEINAVPLVP
jgi:hypothetical protein